MVAQPIRIPAASPRVMPAVITVGAVSAIVGYVQWQFGKSSQKLDSFFASYNTPQSEASRQRTFAGANTDPRTSFFNMLGRK
ncbi:hypothetical protein HJFPF1_02147 [Paramyrothecium foliicola]|nr:hypothetical protein HJFPF1_02147 [Paramyrothecium foliicola]